MIRPMSGHEGIGGLYPHSKSPSSMYCDATRHLELLRLVRLDIFDQQESCPSSCDSISASLEDSRPTLTPKKKVVQIMHCALEKKDFFPNKVCPLYFSEKCRV